MFVNFFRENQVDRNIYRVLLLRGVPFTAACINASSSFTDTFSTGYFAFGHFGINKMLLNLDA